MIKNRWECICYVTLSGRRETKKPLIKNISGFFQSSGALGINYATWIGTSLLVRTMLLSLSKYTRLGLWPLISSASKLA